MHSVSDSAWTGLTVTLITHLPKTAGQHALPISFADLSSTRILRRKICCQNTRLIRRELDFFLLVFILVV